MITGYMTEEEALQELTSDLRGLLAYSDANCDKKFRKDVLHSSIFPIFRRWTWRSRNKNAWSIIYEARSRKEIGEFARIANFCLVEAGFGKYAYMPSFLNQKIMWIIYPPHFFSRFNSRCDKNLIGQSLYDTFFKDNSSYVFSFKDSIEGETMVREVYGSTRDGVAMGVMTVNGNVLFRTFVTYDMLKGEQIETFTKNEEIRREIHGR